MGAQTDPIKAAQVMTLAEAGYNAAEAGRRTDLPPVTAWQIIKRHGRWGEIAELPLFKALRMQQKTHLEAASRLLSAKCLIQVEKTLDKASAYQAAGIYGLLRTHERLDAGEPTSITETLHGIAPESLDDLAKKLSQAMIERIEEKENSKVIK